MKRATARAEDLTADDYARGARLLERKLRRHRPAIAWFQGVSAYRIFLAHLGTPRAKIAAGLQRERIGATRIFVTPNPSGANPAANLDKLIPLYRRLARLRDSLAA